MGGVVIDEHPETGYPVRVQHPAVSLPIADSDHDALAAAVDAASFPHHITVLRGESCVEGDTCPLIARLDDDPQTLHMVVTLETDPAKIAAFASRIGSGELLVKFPARLVPEVS
ncbi:MAG: hypothetical protein DLM62_18555 [Pseudonocardiales bacterium]|nr:MAG: hypothetical protein DLM62_18555 [Pseudonocardiales bacterium]